MAWVGTAEREQNSKRVGCVVLRELPSRPTQRACKLSSDLDAASRELDLKAFPGSQGQQQQQLEAFDSAWRDISTTLQDLRHHTLAPVSNRLQQWVASNGPAQIPHGQGPSSSSFGAGSNTPLAKAPGVLPCGSHQLPIVAWSVATSTNTAATYAELLFTLKSKGHPAALVSARGASSGLSAIINSAMRSFLNEPTAADDIPALLSWWQDACQSAAGPAAAAEEHGGKAQTAATCTAMESGAATPQRGSTAIESGTATPQRGRQAAPAAATPARQLRARTPAKTPGKPGNAKQSSSGVQQLGPPVLILQDADSSDMETLEELVVALSEARVLGLPIVLVLGINITASHLLQLLPNGILRRAHLTALTLPPALTQVTQLYRALLLRAPQPPLILGPQTTDWLLQHFRDVDCSAAMTECVLQLACVEHFRQQPLSCLAAAAATGRRKAVAAAVKQLQQDQLLQCCEALLSHPVTAAHNSTLNYGSLQGAGQEQVVRATRTAASAAAVEHLQRFVRQDSSRSSRDEAAAAAAKVLQDSVWAAMQSYGKWRLGVLLLDMLARFTGAADVDASLQLPAIYTSASQSDFLTVKRKGNLSNCGRLLLKVLGDSSRGSTVRSRANVTVVHALSDSDCVQLLGKLMHLLQDAQLTQKQRQKQQQKQQQQGQPADGAVTADEHDASSCSDGDSDSESESEAGEAAEHGGAQGRDSAAASCEQVQQLQQALQELQSAAAAAVQQSLAPAGAAATRLANVDNCQDLKQQPQEQLDWFAQQFKQLLEPLHDVLEPATAPEGAAGSLISTPAGKGQRTAAAGSIQDAITPGGLASLLRKQVRFAPGTPDHANGKHAGSNTTAHSTPDDVAAAAAAPGLIKTPHKKGSGATQPKRLFAAAAAANAAAAAAKQPRRRKGDKKQAIEEGEIAGSSASVLAAAAGLAQSPTAAPAAAGNKRTQRLMQMMAASGPPGAAAGGGSKRAGRSSSPAGKAVGPTAMAAGSANRSAAAAASPDDSPVPTGRTRSSRNTVATSTGGMIMSPLEGRTAGAAARGGSRLSRQSDPAIEQEQQQHNESPVEEATDAEQDENADPSSIDCMQDQPQKQHSEPPAAAAPVLTCAGMLAALLESVIPKLLINWSCPAGSCGISGEAAAAGSPSSIPLAAAAAAAFVYDDLDCIRSMLSPAPPCAVHAALVNPSQKLPGHPQQLQEGWEDTCLAYVLLQQQRDDSLAVPDWFGLFCQAQGLQGFRGNEGGVVGYNNDSDLDVSDAEQAPVGRAARNKARAGRKARGYAEARETAAGSAAASSSKGPSKASATPKSAGKKRAAASSSKVGQDDVADAEVDEQQLLSAAARFCQAAAELQVLGVWKAAKKRRMAAVHRVFAPGGQLMAGAQAADVDSLADYDYE